MRERVLVTGASGQVGFELARAFSFCGDVLTPSRQTLNLADTQAVSQYLSDYQPSVILNAAAYTAVDQAEREPDACYRLNATLPRVLADYVKQQAEQGRNVTLVHFSSDYVYPGNGDEPWQETSAMGPLSVYGQSKLAGDEAIQQRLHGARFYILRTSWVYSARGQNFMKTMLRLGKERSALSVVNDQVGAPTTARLLAQLSVALVRQQVPSGIYHAAPRGETSWCDFAKRIFELSEGRTELAIKASDVTGIPTRDYPTPATRPLNSRMNVSKIEQALGIELPHWESELALTLDEYLGVLNRGV